MKIKINLEKLLSRLDSETEKCLELNKDKQAVLERTLFLILSSNLEDLRSTFENFELGDLHSCFRKYDVLSNWKLDMAVYLLLEQSNLFWSIYAEEYNKNKEKETLQFCFKGLSL